MANIKSAIKRIDVTKRQTAENRRRKSQIKTFTRRFEAAVEEGNKDEALKMLQHVDRLYKRAVHRNIFHKNKAARMVSRLQKQYNTL